MRQSDVPVVCDGDSDVFLPPASAREAPDNFQRGFAAWFADDLNIDPADAARAPCSEGLHRRFLGREMAGEPLGAVAVFLAIGDFRRGEQPLKKRAVVQNPN